MSAKFDLSKIEVLKVEGINPKDAPDFVDAFISEASTNGLMLNDADLESLNEEREFVHAQVLERLR